MNTKVEVVRAAFSGGVRVRGDVKARWDVARLGSDVGSADLVVLPGQGHLHLARDSMEGGAELNMCHMNEGGGPEVKGMTVWGTEVFVVAEFAGYSRR